MRIAANHWVRRGEEWVDGEPSFYDITAWDKLAVNPAESMRKGDRILVTGQLHAEAWTNTEGAKHITAPSSTGSMRGPLPARTGEQD